MLTRIISASLMFPVALALLWAGSPYRDLFILCITLILLGEWNHVCYQASRAFTQKWTWAIFGSLYITCGCYGFWFIGERMHWLWQLYIVSIVAASDTGAYFVGRFFQGPKLAPSISPKKTWSGSVGGIISTVLVGLPFFLMNLQPPIVTQHLTFTTFFEVLLNNLRHIPLEFLGVLILIHIALSVVAQAGDLVESWAKRRLNVKDISQLIPGHGGLLDRVDGLLLVSIIFSIGLHFLYFAHQIR